MGQAICDGRRNPSLCFAGVVTDRQTAFAEMFFRKQTELFGLFLELNSDTFLSFSHVLDYARRSCAKRLTTEVGPCRS